jgi:nicotinamide-nucleotide amidase
MDLEALACEVGQALKQRSLVLTTAESCTGGWVAQTITSAPGSSHWFDRGFVTYTDLSKHELLGVSVDTLTRYGAVSEQTVRAMAEGALTRSHAQVSLAITGIAGPAGGAPEKPIGTMWLAWAGKNRDTVSAREQFPGDRQSIRREAVLAALEGLLRFVNS